MKPQSAALADDHSLSIVETADYERLKGAGIGAPLPGHRFAYVLHDPGRDPEDVLYVRRGAEGEWEETAWPDVHGTIPLSPGDAIRVAVAKPRLVLGGFV